MIDHFALGQAEIDRDLAAQRAVDLIAEDPTMTTEAVLAAVDDEFRGSYFWPSADRSFIDDVDRLVFEASRS